MTDSTPQQYAVRHGDRWSIAIKAPESTFGNIVLGQKEGDEVWVDPYTDTYISLVGDEDQAIELKNS